MIVFKELRWSNAFSYGTNNKIDFNAKKLVQLIGKNGHGKSSIALILEEVLFNKNSKGVKKGNILNRNSKAKSYSIELDFEKDYDEYKIITNRGTTQTVKLLKNGEDISAHTATGTYKLIEDILESFDSKTFSQIVYQSNAYSLEFLTATDSNRKKFLIDLLNLTKYSEAHEYFKNLSKELSKELEVNTAKLESVTNWLNKTKTQDISIKELIKDIPTIDSSIVSEIKNLKEEISNIETTNKKIVQNNKYIEIRDSITFDILQEPTEDLTQLAVISKEKSNELTKLNNIITGTGPIYTKCPTCGQPVDKSHERAMLEEAKAMLPEAEKQVRLASENHAIALSKWKEFNANKKKQEEWEKYHTLINPSMRKEVLVENILYVKLKDLEKQLADTEKEINRITKYNSEVATHNARSEHVIMQIQTMQEDLLKYKEIVSALEFRINNIQLLVKTFSPTGLVAYKIEVLVKDLEKLVNEYLQDMSDGRFQLFFKVNSSDKLDVVITDNGVDIDIYALSNGELARVNVSTLLAIRKLMQSLSGSRVNLLILDETVESLDIDGKERLIEVLLKEEHLNTVLVSHGFSHPLLEKVHIIKENNISRIE